MKVIGFKKLMERDGIRLSFMENYLMRHDGEWFVYKLPMYVINRISLYRGDSQEEAISALLHK